MIKLNRRSFITTSAVATMGFASPALMSSVTRETVRLGFVGMGGRGSYLASFVSGIPGASVAAVCDPDSERLAKQKKKYPDAKDYADMRALFENKNIDAVVIATCNHWHCLAAIWAMQAGKNVYIEKPFCMSFWEGKQVVAAAKKYNKICQLGTQMRTDPLFHPEVKKFLHQDKELGAIRSVRINRYAPRPSIGKRETPLEIPATVNYDLWLGPAQDRPIYRNQLQYDWHWMWYTGHGETGNWGAHLIDDCRNDILCDRVSMPKRVLAGGGRLGYNDVGDSPNSMFVLFDTGIIPVVFCISNLPDGKNRRSTGVCPGPTSGYVAYCEGGRYEKYWGGAYAFDKDGKQIRHFKGTTLAEGSGLHLANFVSAVAKHDPNILHCPIQIGYDSAAWYNGANTAYRLGQPYSKKAALAIPGTDGRLAEAIDNLETHLTAQGIKVNADTFRMSDFVEIDSQNGCFSGQYGSQANELMNIQYRKPFVVPQID